MGFKIRRLQWKLAIALPAWITPDPLPLPPPQRSFVASQENLLVAVESWVAEY
ncbi:MAG: hypothetical protein ACRCU2_32725 [Planktothrix sp.]